MKKLEPEVRKCLQQLHVKSPVRVTVRVAPRGAATVRAIESPGPRPTACVRQALRGVTFRATRRGGSIEHQFDP
jgi:hypothetical protein